MSSNKESVVTIPELRKKLRIAREVYIQPRFGTSERWLKVTKAEVTYLLTGVNDDTTPEDLEMYGSVFAEWDVERHILYLG